jgi:hypothetical protein
MGSSFLSPSFILTFSFKRKSPPSSRLYSVHFFFLQFFILWFFLLFSIFPVTVCFSLSPYVHFYGSSFKFQSKVTCGSVLTLVSLPVCFGNFMFLVVVNEGLSWIEVETSIVELALVFSLFFFFFSPKIILGIYLHFE